MIDPSALFGLQASLMSVVSVFVARWYLVPWLQLRPFAQAVTPLLLLHGTRVVGLSFLALAVRGPDVPQALALTAASGDTIAAVLSLLAAVRVRADSRAARPLVFLANVVGLADILTVSIWGVFVDFPSLQLGATWFIPTVLGPIMLTTHGLMFWLLARKTSPSTERSV